MKQIVKKTVIIVGAMALCLISTHAMFYTDITLDAAGVDDMDITTVEVTNDAVSVNFAMTFNASTIGLNAGKSISIHFDTKAGGETTGNAWNTTNFMSDGMDFFTGSFSNGAGAFEANTYSADLGGWPEWQNAANDTWVEWTAPIMAGNTLSLSVSRASLGLLVDGESFDFDVLTFWDGWTQDSLGAATDIGGNLYDTAGTLNTYTLVAVPEPASSTVLMALMAGAMLVVRRKCRA
jgi:hypothetical protein